ncbi:MAG: 5'-3' exonuclease H3TH domain-containing protein, partial [Clostridia bacterium]
MDKLLLIDGNSIINRAYFALPPLNDDKGRNVNAVYGFINILFKAISDISPTKLVVTFDKRGDNFRKKIYAEYKANRKGMPDDLAEQMPILHNLLSSMRVKVVESAGIEADDIIGTLSKKFQFPTYIVSGDRDMLQLVDDTTSVILTKRGVSEIETVNIDNIVNLYGLTPTQIIEYKALRGDTSDNIPGVKGVGEKTAMSLLDSYKTLDGVYEHLSDVKGAMGDKLAQGKEMAYISKVLATIVTDVEVDCDLQDCNLPTLTAETKAQFDSLNFRGLISKLTFEQASETKGIVAVPKEIETIIVDNLQQLSLLVSELSNKDIFAIFISKDITVAYNVTKEYKITISENFLDGINFEQAIFLLKPLFEGNSKKIIYDSKLLRHTLDEYNIAINNICDDVCLMQYLVEYSAYKDFQSLKTHYDLLGEAVALFNLRDILYKQ